MQTNCTCARLGSPQAPVRSSVHLANLEALDGCTLARDDTDSYNRDRPGHDLRYSNDSTKIRTELGWEPRYADFRAGLAATIDWYRNTEWWWKPQNNATEARYQKLGR